MPAIISSAGNSHAVAYKRRYTCVKSRHQQHRQRASDAASDDAAPPSARSSASPHPVDDVVDSSAAAPAASSSSPAGPSSSLMSRLPEFPRLPAAIASLAMLGGGRGEGRGGGGGGGKQRQEPPAAQQPLPAKKRPPAALPKRAYQWDDARGKAVGGAGGDEQTPSSRLPSATEPSSPAGEEDEERLRSLQSRGTRSEGSSPSNHGLQSSAAGRRASATNAGAARFLGRTSSPAIPLPSSHVRRTASELQLRDDMAEAERRDWAMYARCVVRGGVTPNPTPPLPCAQQMPHHQHQHLLLQQHQQAAAQHQQQQQQELMQQLQHAMMPHYQEVSHVEPEPEPQFGLSLDGGAAEDDGGRRCDNAWPVAQPQPQRQPRHHLPAVYVLKPVPVKASAAAAAPPDAASNYHNHRTHHTQDYFASSSHEEEEEGSGSQCLFDMEL